MRSRDESEILRRRADDQASSLDQGYQAPTSAVSSEFYLVTIGDEDGAVFPTTGLNTVFMVMLLDDLPLAETEGTVVAPTASGPKYPAINLGDAVPTQDETMVRCDTFEGQLFFTYRGNGSAT